MTSALGDIIFLSQTYRRNCEVISRAHYLSSDELRKRHLQLGIPVLIASTFVGTTIFGTLQSEPAIGWKIATGVISIGAALLAGLQTLLNFSERVENTNRQGPAIQLSGGNWNFFNFDFSIHLKANETRL